MTGGGASSTFKAKYGEDNVRQLAVQIFDYIRCTNLYDGGQARWNNGDLTGVTQSVNGNFGRRYDEADRRAPNRYTYTNHRATPSWTGDDDKTASQITDPARVSDDTSVLPGHGTVTPAAWNTGGKTYMGFGRFLTISEIGLHFICTADGYVQPYNPATPDAPYSVGMAASKGANFNAGFDKLSGGVSAVRCDQAKMTYGAPGPPRDYEPLKNSNVSNLAQCNLLQGANAQWWSNFPPLQGAPSAWVHPKTGKNILTDYYGCDTTKPAGPLNSKHPSLHPGLYPENWNLTLAYNTPLEPQNASGKGGEKRVQANIDIETFCPMSGWTKMYPEFTIVLDGDYIAQIKLKSGTGAAKRLFNTSGAIAVKSNDNQYERSGIHSIGGHASPAALLFGRASNSFAVDADGLPTVAIPDPEYDLSPSKPRDGLNNYALASNFITVIRDEPMTITFPNAPMKVRIYDTHDWQNHDAVQIISVKFPDINAPTPELPSPRGKVNNFRVYPDGLSSLDYYRSYQGPHWWVYNSLGCIGRMRGRPDGTWKDGQANFWAQQPTPLLEEDIPQAIRGRLHNQIGVMAKPPTGNVGRGLDLAPYASNGNNPEAKGTVVSLPFEITDNSNATRVDMNTDVVRTMIPAVGDYRMIAARYDVPESMWVPHPMWQQQASLPVITQTRTIHSYTGHWGNNEPGFKLAVDPSTRKFLAQTGHGLRRLL